MATMKYNVVTDENNYVVLIRHTGSPRDFVELDLNDYDFSDDKLTAYKLTNDGLVFDQNKYETEILKVKEEKEDQKKINSLQTELDDTDYICAKNVEQMMVLAEFYLNGSSTIEFPGGPTDITIDGIGGNNEDSANTLSSPIYISDSKALQFIKSVMRLLYSSYGDYTNTIAERESARNGINSLRRRETE